MLAIIGGSGFAKLAGLGNARREVVRTPYGEPSAPLLFGRLAGREVVLDGAAVYAEKNWGRGGFPPSWWWGQAHGFDREDICVAFAGGEIVAGPFRHHVTAIVVRLGGQLIRLGDPIVSPVAAEVTDTSWRLKGRGLRWGVEIEGEAALADGHVLPVPLPAEP